MNSQDKSARVHLFGSRLDDNKKGEDIDLIIVSDKLEFRDKYKIYSLTTHTLLDQKFEMIIYNGKYKIILQKNI